MTIKAGKHWELPISVVGRKMLDNNTDLVTVNINKGAIIVLHVWNSTILTGWYDGYGGPKIRDFSKLYIWNSELLSTTGKPKKDFCISKKDLEEIIWAS